MKTNWIMKTRTFAAVATLGTFCAASHLMADGGPPECPPEPECDPEVDPCECPDPAFLGVDNQPAESLSERRARESQSFDGSEPAITGTEAGAWQEIEARFATEPDGAYQVALEVWSLNHSTELQRLAILRAKELVESTDETANLDFMLACLEDPEAHREENLRLGRGNGLERNLAAKRLAILTANPRLEGR